MSARHANTVAPYHNTYRTVARLIWLAGRRTGGEAAFSGGSCAGSPHAYVLAPFRVSGEPDPPHQLRVPWILAQRSVARIELQVEQPRRSLLIRTLQTGERLVE